MNFRNFLKFNKAEKEVKPTKIDSNSKYNRALSITEKDMFGNETKSKDYKPGNIQEIYKKRIGENGEYKSHIDEAVKRTEEKLDELYEKIDRNEKASENFSSNH